MQYYQFENDATGRLLMRALREAALRGVKVRLLVDDLYTAKSQDLLLALSEAPGVKVRLFNPFCCGGSGVLQRFVASPNFMQRNHRMHNKLFIADSAMAVVGGRNIADEYFVLSPAQNFIDMDALVVGEVLPQLGRMSAAWRPLRTWPTGTSRSRCWPIRWPRRMSRLCTPAMRATASVCSRATWTSTS